MLPAAQASKANKKNAVPTMHNWRSRARTVAKRRSRAGATRKAQKPQAKTAAEKKPATPPPQQWLS